MKQTELNSRQARWALKLAAFDFEIFHRAGKLNPADAPSRRPDYEGAPPLNTTLLPTLQNKLALWTGAEPSEEGKKVLVGMAPALRIAGVSVVIPRNEVRAIPETAYDEPQRPTKSVIRELQAHDDWVSSFRVMEGEPAVRRRKRNQAWALDNEGLLRYEDRLYVPGDIALRTELISKCHDDPLSGHFGAAKTQELLARKYHWQGIAKEVAEYVHTCDVCQRTKAPRHRPYGELISLPPATSPWKELSMDFITGLPGAA